MIKLSPKSLIECVKMVAGSVDAMSLQDLPEQVIVPIPMYRVSQGNGEVIRQSREHFHKEDLPMGMYTFRDTFCDMSAFNTVHALFVLTSKVEHDQKNN